SSVHDECLLNSDGNFCRYSIGLKRTDRFWTESRRGGSFTRLGDSVCLGFYHMVLFNLEREKKRNDENDLCSIAGQPNVAFAARWPRSFVNGSAAVTILCDD